MTKYSREDIESILEISYYDRRTDYVWKYIMGEEPELEHILYPIPNLESFQVMHNMLRHRQESVSDFLEEWNSTQHLGLLDCQFNNRSGILRVKARSFTFTYRSKLNEYHFVAYANIARCIGLNKRITRKKYRKNGLFSLTYLQELDEQLYSRYSEKQSIMAWRKSEQFAIDCYYCEAMIPFIMNDAERKRHLLGAQNRLNIILSGKEKVRIGIVKDYSPEEMIGMPSFPRSEWKTGILNAFEEINKEYNKKIENRRIEMQQWSDELSQIILRKTPFSLKDEPSKFYMKNPDDSYTSLVLLSALNQHEELPLMKKCLDASFFADGFWGIKTDVKNSSSYTFDTFSISINFDEDTATITLKEKVAEALNYEVVNKVRIPRNLKIDVTMLEVNDTNLKDRYKDFLTTEERKRRPQHQLLIEEVRYIIDQAAPLVTYTGPISKISQMYSMYLSVGEDDRVKVMIRFSDWVAVESFSLENYQTEFRVWWSQQLLKECKFAKQCALDPENYNPF